jgi:hypothetical protein
MFLKLFALKQPLVTAPSLNLPRSASSHRHRQPQVVMDNF